jgi:hypothetical protein
VSRFAPVLHGSLRGQALGSHAQEVGVGNELSSCNWLRHEHLDFLMCFFV